MGKAKVLVVDDDPMIRRVLERILSEFDVDSAEDGQTALDMVRGADYDVILSDIDMPRKNGVDFMREAVGSGRADRDSFVFMSAMLTGENALSLVRDDFLVVRKPFVMSYLVEVVRERVLTRALRVDKIRA